MDIINLIHELPWHETRIWETREPESIDKIIVHQELSDGTIEAVNQYHIQPNHISSQGCPHFCYHYGIRMFGNDGEVVQANEHAHITWHTKDQNETGIGIMLEGNFKGIGHPLGHDRPTEAQMDSLEQLVDQLIGDFDLSHQDVYGHYHFGKPACPGFAASDWIESYRNRGDDDPATVVGLETIQQVQEALNRLGFDCGPADGIIGPRTSRTIRRFQSEHGLLVDGIPGPQTRKQLLLLLNR